MKEGAAFWHIQAHTHRLPFSKVTVDLSVVAPKIIQPPLQTRFIDKMYKFAAVCKKQIKQEPIA